ncbi:MAG: diguanylate cyclase, partial [Oleispira antarctica]|nr:diguanylate cyclase [Oleispira antarctica]MBQ0792416.1 diguanylate cyclase [Oleispira antarctica]
KKKIRNKGLLARTFVEGSMVAATFAEAGEHETALDMMAETSKKIRDLSHAQSNEQYVTISLGVAAMVPSMSDNEENLLRDADRCLYQAKAEGRNCVVS